MYFHALTEKLPERIYKGKEVLKLGAPLAGSATEGLPDDSHTRCQRANSVGKS
jgi:hypothetical protein